MCVCECFVSVYMVFVFLLDQKALAERSTRHCTSVASYAACRGGLTFKNRASYM